VESQTLYDIARDLENSSKWLKQTGFPAPVLKSLTRYYEAIVTKDENHGLYYIDSKQLLLNPDHLKSRDEGRGAASHEIFHAIQAGYSKPNSVFADEHYDWIWEGTADAVAHTWLKKNKSWITTPAGEYQYPLHDPNDPYSTLGFWFDIGLKFSLDPNLRIQYLDEMFEMLEPSKMNGLMSVDAFFKEKLGPNQTLYELYPWFIARNAVRHVYQGVDIKEIILTHPGGEKEVSKTLSRKVRHIASDPIVLKVDVPDGFNGSLRVEILKSNDDLHLIVDTDRYDQAERGDQRNIADIPVQGDQEFFIRVSNVAREIIKTKDKKSYKLKLTLIPETDCGTPRPSILETVSGQTLNPNNVPPGKGVMRVGGAIADTGIVCSEVKTGVPSFQSGLGGILDMGKDVVSFQLYTPGTNEIEIQGVPWPYHGGVGGWSPGSRFDVSVKIPEVKWEEIKQGKTYKASVKTSFMHWKGSLIPVHANGKVSNILNGTKTHNWANLQHENGTVKILRKTPSNDPDGGTNLRVEIVAENNYTEGTFSRYQQRSKIREDGTPITFNENNQNLDKIFFYSVVDVHCIGYQCRWKNPK